MTKKITSIICCALMMLFFVDVQAQVNKEDKVAKSDSVITNTQDMKLEIMQLRRKVKKLQGTIYTLNKDIKGMATQLNNLSTQKEKTEEEYAALEQYATQILKANDSLTLATSELKQTNEQISQSKGSVEVAANALREVLENERRKLVNRTESFKSNYAKACTDITHETKRGVVLLDNINTHKLSWINDFNLIVNTCFAMPKEEASNNVKVYFNLYREGDSNRQEPVESSVPIVLTPNKEASDNALIYYDGELIVALPTNDKKALKTTFLYEVEYQEEVIASGKFRLD